MRPSRVTKYEQALDLLYERINYEKIGHAPYTANHYRLDRMRSLLELLGNPHLDCSIVHVAGTKGKGTTASLISDGLRACGLKTGLVTSPHLLRLEERMQFQGKPCSPTELVALADLVLSAADTLDSRGIGRPTFFELTTAMGILYASQQAADCLVLEVGLGGRLDSTNVCLPVVSVITSISLDHQLQLGNTIAEIAAEKGGIIKPGIPVVCSARHPDAQRVIAEIAERQQSPLLMIGQDFDADWKPNPIAQPDFIQSSSDRCSATIRFWRKSHSLLPEDTEQQVTTQLLGRHQADNFAATLTAFELLRSLGWQLPLDCVEQALARSSVAARLQICQTEPIGIIDTAHNPASITAAIDALDAHFPKTKRTIVFGSSKDKDFRTMLQLLIPSCSHLITTAYQLNPRGLPVDELTHSAMAIREELQSQAGTGAGLANIVSAATPSEAWSLAQSLTSKHDLILATGSFFLAAELLPMIVAHP